jgi:hypothetical protein
MVSRFIQEAASRALTSVSSWSTRDPARWSWKDMGSNWVAVREAVTAGTLRATDKTAPEVASRFDALLLFASLRLGRQLGPEVLLVLSRKEQAEPALRAQALLSRMVTQGQLYGSIRIPHAVAPIQVVADLRSGRTCSVDVDVPQGR